MALAKWEPSEGLATLQREMNRLLGLAAAPILQPTVAQYAQYFRYLEVGIFANSFGPYEAW
jgi:hypothetical protein